MPTASTCWSRSSSINGVLADPIEPGRGGHNGLAHGGSDHRYRHRDHGRAHDMDGHAIQKVDRFLIDLHCRHARHRQSGPLHRRRVDRPPAAELPTRSHAAGRTRMLVGHQPCSCQGGHTTWTAPPAWSPGAFGTGTSRSYWPRGSMYAWRWSMAPLNAATGFASCARAFADDRPEVAGVLQGAALPPSAAQTPLPTALGDQTPCPSVPTPTSFSPPCARPATSWPPRSATSTDASSPPPGRR